MGTSSILLVIMFIIWSMMVILFWLFYYCTNEKFGGHAEVKADIVPMLKFASFKVG